MNAAVLLLRRQVRRLDPRDHQGSEVVRVELSRAPQEAPPLMADRLFGDADRIGGGAFPSMCERVLAGESLEGVAG